MKLIECRTCHMKNPLGYAMERAVVSWIAGSDVSRRQKAARIVVAADAQMGEILYDSGLDPALSGTGTVLPIELEGKRRYYWTVQVQGEAGDEAISEVNWFETGLRENRLGGEWITTPWADKNRHPYLRRRFCLPSDVKKARLYVTGAGIYELEINGRRVGEERLAPGSHSMDGWVQVQTLDVTNELHSGENVLGAMLGNGWSKGKFGVFKECAPYVKEFLLRAELDVCLADGTEMVLTTDTEWECAPGPVMESSIYDGEVYDAQKEIAGWSMPFNRNGASEKQDDTALSEQCTAQKWEKAVTADVTGLGAFEDRLSLPVVVKEIRKPAALLHTPAGEQVLDMGQNMTGWLRFRVQEPAGTKIRIQYGEVLQEGNFYRDNLRSAKAEYVYISDGTQHVAEPHFTFFGFRYAKIEGLTGPVNPDDFEGCVVYSDMEETGWLKTSHAGVNRLFENAKWSQKCNFLDVPTDCPQRDERMGWTGDAQVFCKTAAFNMDTYEFYTKFLHDMWKEQQMCGGMVAHILPSMLPEQEKQKEADFLHGGSAAWADAATIIPWTVYEQYGDEEILRRQYPGMKAWVDWVYRQDEKTGGTRLWKDTFHFGDWLALDGPEPDGVEGGTDKNLIASAYYRHSAQLTAKAARVLGKEEEALWYQELSEQVKAAVNRAFYTENGRCKVHTQTAYVLALAFDLVGEEAKSGAAQQLAELLRENGGHLQTGFVGTPLLCRVLSKYGYSDLAYALLLGKEYPGWLYEVGLGATTIWERWNSVLPDGRISGTEMNSLNHYAYGSIAQWMYENMCGVQVLEPGYRRFRIAPEISGELSEASMAFRSPKGMIRAGWKRWEDGRLEVKVSVPFDAAAQLVLPLSGEEKELEAGDYTFVVS